MDLRQLTTFRVAAMTLSFTRTAATLNYVQSSVTAQIQSLEEELGVPLFDRLGKKLILTDAGARLLVYAGKLLDLADEAKAAVSGRSDPTGVVTISAPETLCTYRLPEVLHRFRQRYPQVTLRLKPHTVIDPRRYMLEAGADVAFILERPPHLDGVIIETLFPEPLLLLAAPDHPLVGAPVVRPAEQMLLTEIGCGYRGILERQLATAGVRATSTLEFDSVEAIKQCVMAGMGITVLPAVTAQRELVEGRLVALPWTEPGFEVLTEMVLHKDKWISPALRAFLDVARETLQRNRQDAPVVHSLEGELATY
jgi:DNA-binding transcriptional LysR family regulator